MKRVYKRNEEDELWTDYGNAYSVILLCLENRYPEMGRVRWGFNKAYITSQGRAYTVSASFTRFDKDLSEISMVSCNAKGHLDKREIESSCGERIPVEFDDISDDYEPKIES